MRKITNLACAAVLLSTTNISSALAADESKTPSSLETVTVTATKSPTKTFDLPAMATVIDTSNPSIAAPSNVKNILSQIPGVEFNGSARRNGQNIVMRGYGTDGLTVLLDGVRQKSESGHDGKFFVDPNLLKRVEVIKGPSSALYGSGGLGGVIAFETKDAADLLRPGENKGVMTTFGLQSVNEEWMASQSGYAVSDKFDILVNATTRNSDDVKLGDGSKLDSQDRVLSGLFKLGWQVDPSNKLKLNISGSNNDSKEPNNPQENDNDDLVNKDVFSQRASLDYEYSNPNNNLVSLKAKIYHNDINIDESAVDDGTRLSRKIATNGFNLENQSHLNLGKSFKNTFTYGGEYYQEKQNGSDSRAANGQYGAAPDAKASYGALFLQDEINIDLGSLGKLLAIPAVRIDSYKSKNQTGTSIDKQQTSPKFGLTYKPQDWLMVFGNYAEGFRAPTMTESFTSGTHFSIPGSGSNVFVSNPDLRPETNQSTEFGFGMQFDDVAKANDHLQFKFSRFDIDSTDFIDLDVDFTFSPSCCGTTKSVNVGKAKLWGHEFEGGYENDRILFKLGYSYITGKNSEDGEYLTNITPLTFTTDLALKLPEYDSVVGVKSTFADKHDKVNDSDEVRDGYAVHDLYYQIQPSRFENITLNLGVDNILNKNYERVFAGSPEPSRNYKMQINYKW